MIDKLWQNKSNAICLPLGNKYKVIHDRNYLIYKPFNAYTKKIITLYFRKNLLKIHSKFGQNWKILYD